MSELNDFFDSPLYSLSSVGTSRAKVLASEANLHTCRDLLYYFPYKYIDRRKIYQVADIRDESIDIQLRGVITSYSMEGVGHRKLLRASFEDETGMVELVWFKSFHYIPKAYPVGKEVIIFGRPSLYKHTYNFQHPEILLASKADTVTGGFMGVYHTTSKMKRSQLDSKGIRNLILSILPYVKERLPDTLTPDLLQQLNLIPLVNALVWAHLPVSERHLSAALERLKFDELFFLRLSLEETRRQRQQRFAGFHFHEVGLNFNTLYASLPFDLTNAQKRVLKEIRIDTNKGHQMNRLLHGDVGSGKTLVAAFAMMLALDNGYQSCMMAPTEILAQQHYTSLNDFFEPIGMRVALLTGSTSTKERNVIYEGLASGNIQMVVGTHALLEDTVQFSKLGLAIIDEQHRFGVAQRAKMWKKSNGCVPHILIMSATPIPRTLAMTLYGDLDVSVLDELPPGRKPIETSFLEEHQENQAYSFAAEKIIEGRQVYVVFPMIEGSEESDFKNLETGYKRFVELFGEKNITYVHGKLQNKDKQARMESFVSGEKPILLATTVIEVGVNVPNATVMIIENANRFGLAQLHQLRGRVGRGDQKSYCILIGKGELSFTGRQRIKAMCNTNDGFKIAEEDLRLRGEGDMEGTRQSGVIEGLNLASPSKDALLLKIAAQVAEHLYEVDPNQESEQYKPVWNYLHKKYPASQRWGNIS